jgi:RNA polymerase sigma-B factor
MSVLTMPPALAATAENPGTSVIPAESRTRLSSLTTEQLLCERDRLPADHPDRNRLRAQAIEANLPFAHMLARRYAGRGELLEDLYQVAAMALVKVVDRYDPQRESAFASYAIPTILGELKRHFRDASRPVHVPRGTQELSRAVAAAIEELSQSLSHSPTTAELAAHLGVGVDDVRRALAAARAYHLTSLNNPLPTAGGTDSLDLVDLIGDVDPHFADVDDHLTLLPLMATLSTRERRILAMRFYANMTQTQIGTEVGLSQMHVSRLLTQSLTRLRGAMLRPPLSSSPTATRRPPTKR